MDYLVWRRENRLPACTPYDITHKAPNLTSTQRQQRIESILITLEKAGLVGGQRFEKASYFAVTDRGVNWYKTIAKGFYDVFETSYGPTAGGH